MFFLCVSSLCHQYQDIEIGQHEFSTSSNALEYIVPKNIFVILHPLKGYDDDYDVEVSIGSEEHIRMLGNTKTYAVIFDSIGIIKISAKTNISLKYTAFNITKVFEGNPKLKCDTYGYLDGITTISAQTRPNQMGSMNLIDGNNCIFVTSETNESTSIEIKNQNNNYLLYYTPEGKFIHKDDIKNKGTFLALVKSYKPYNNISLILNLTIPDHQNEYQYATSNSIHNGIIGYKPIIKIYSKPRDWIKVGFSVGCTVVILILIGIFIIWYKDRKNTKELINNSNLLIESNNVKDAVPVSSPYV